ncbi:MAG: hypothetical protein KDA51_06540 [Planctomycetales bacterium]|nr:hypothetical protein [Planctomycetales bacterium]
MERLELIGLSRLDPDARREITLSNGHTLSFGKIRFKHIRMREQHVLSMRVSPTVNIDKALVRDILALSDDDKVINAFVTSLTEIVKVAAMRPAFPTAEEMRQFRASDEDTAYMLYLTLYDEPANRINDVDDAKYLHAMLTHMPDYKEVLGIVYSFCWNMVDPKNYSPPEELGAPSTE